MIVADTYLIFHLFNETHLTSKAQEVLNKDPQWVFPPLWKEEYANVLSKLARKEHHAIEDVIAHFNYTVDQLKHGEVVVDAAKALEMSIKYKFSVYDAHFIVLARDFNTILVTEDQEVLKRCPTLAQSLNDFLKS